MMTDPLADMLTRDEQPAGPDQGEGFDAPGMAYGNLGVDPAAHAVTHQVELI